MRVPCHVSLSLSVLGCEGDLQIFHPLSSSRTCPTCEGRFPTHRHRRLLYTRPLFSVGSRRNWKYEADIQAGRESSYACIVPELALTSACTSWKACGGRCVEGCMKLWEAD